MNDGNSVFWGGGIFGKSWKVQKLLSSQLNIKSVIIVAITPLDRTWEYTHGYCCVECGKNYGGYKEYTNYIAFHLKPFIDNNYKTIPDAKHTFITGASHGALSALWLSIIHPTIFGNAICFSPSIGTDIDTDFKLNTTLKFTETKLIREGHNTFSNDNLRPNLFLHWGLKRKDGFHNETIEENITLHMKELIHTLINNYGYVLNYNLYLNEDPTAGHEEDDWSRNFLLALNKFDVLQVK